MNKDRIEGNWQQLKGKVVKTIAQLTDNEIALMQGNRQIFHGKLVENYGIAKEVAQKRIKGLSEESASGSTLKNAA